MRHCERKEIKNQTRKISEERLCFKDGAQLGEISVFIDGGATRRMVRRIVEKRVCQEYWKGRKDRNSNGDRYSERHFVSNQLKNIYGSVPRGFNYN